MSTEKVKEMKNKAGSGMDDLVGLVQREFIDLENVRDYYIEPLVENEDEISNNLDGKPIKL